MPAHGKSAMTKANLDLQTVVDTFTEFFIVAIHQILQQRKVYEPAISIPAKKYNLPVHQIRHPGLCAFVNSEVAATRQAILRKTARRVYVAIFVLGVPRKHFIFHIARMSRMDVGMMREEFDSLPQVDAEEQMRAALSKLKGHCALLEPLDAQTTFRIVVGVDEDSTYGFDNEQRGKGIPDPSQGGRCCIKEHATKMVKIRGVEAGRLAFDLWYEHAQPTPQLSGYTSSQPLGSDGAPSSSTNVYGTPLTQMELDDQNYLDRSGMSSPKVSGSPDR